MNSALKDVKSNCTDQTYETVSNYILNSKIKEYEDIKKQLDKKNKEYEELTAIVIIKQKDINYLEKDIQTLRIKEDGYDDQRKKLKRRSDFLDEKEKRLHNAEMSLIFKEKLNSQGKKRFDRQKQESDSTKASLEKIYSQLMQIWNKIVDGTWQKECECGCWRQQVMKKCKDQLLQQRKLLQQQQKTIEREYQTLRNLSDQLKKMLVSDGNKKPQELVKK